MTERKEELKILLMRVKEESEKSGLKLNIQKTKIMASGPITSWQIERRSRNSDRFCFPGLQNHCSDCKHEVKKMLIPWKKSYDKPRQHIKKRDITLPTKVCIVKAMVFPVVMYRCESWAIKKAKHRRIDAFKLWCWKRFLRALGLEGDQTSPS